jgi:hypothetical protein
MVWFCTGMLSDEPEQPNTTRKQLIETANLNICDSRLYFYVIRWIVTLDDDLYISV